MILSLTGHGIAVTFVAIAFLIVNPTPASFSFGFATPEERVINSRLSGLCAFI